jgi:predicted small lipoprotein YifL
MAYSVAVIQSGIYQQMQSTKVVLIMLFSVTLLTACGLKGPLYLPADEPQPSESAVSDDDRNNTTEDEKETKKDNPLITVNS